MEVNVSKHARGRAKERIGLNKKSVVRQAVLALERGVTHGKMKGGLKRWVDYEALRVNYPVNLYIYYNSHLFLFRTRQDETTLVTMLKVPSKIMKKINNYIK